MSQSPDERFLDVALELGVLTPEQHADAQHALELVTQAGLSASAAAVLVDKGYASPKDTRAVKEELSRRGEEPSPGAAPSPGAGSAPAALDGGALQALAAAEDDATEAARRDQQAEEEVEEAAGAEEYLVGPEEDLEESSLDGLDEGAGPSAPPKGGRRFPRVPRRVRRILLWVLPILAAIAVIWVIVSGVRSYIAGQELTRLEEARRAAKRGRPKLALRLYDPVVNGMSRHAETARAERDALKKRLQAAGDLYTKARKLYTAKDYVAAARAFQDLKSRYPRSGDWVRYAEADLARCRKTVYDATIAKARAAERKESWAEAARLYREAAPYGDGGDALARSRQASAKGGAFDRSMRLGRRELEAKRWLSAARHYAEALRVSSGHAGAAAGLAKALNALRKPDGMVLVLPGTAEVGEAGEARSGRVAFLGCYMDVHEVTHRQYAAFVRAKRRPPPPHWPGGRMPKGSADLPVVCVTWADAAAYAAWKGRRLPTSLEWEVAARGLKGLVYPWGNAFRRENAVYSLGPASVGSSPPDRSPSGCMDMAGNVSEWVADTTKDAAGGELRVVRGCSWAGLEPQRRSRVIPAAPGASAGPERRVVVDAPGRRVLPVFYPADRSFTYVSDSLKKPLFRFFLWVPSARGWVRRSQAFAVGEAVRFAQSVVVRGAGRRRLDLKFDTGYRVLRVTGRGEGVALKNAAGAIRSLIKSENPSFGPLPTRAPPSAGNRRRPTASLAHVARLANRLAAPPEGAALNLGFRCAKDLLSWTKTLTKP